MVDITRPQAVKFANEKARVFADLVERTRRTAQQFLVDVVAFESGTAGNADADVINDGSDVDGRNRVTKGNVAQLKFVAEQLVAALTIDDRQQIVARWSVNGQPVF